MKIHLVTYGTRRFRHRQAILGWSARLNGEVAGITHWNPEKLLSSGFQQRCPDISLQERGGGWWAWKPFVILRQLEMLNEGEWLLYCDIGRTFPLKLIDHPLANLVHWTETKRQPCMPGVNIPQNGAMSCWTKRDAFILTDMDRPENHCASPIQASFSLWKKCPEAIALAEQWLDWCADRRLVTDDPNTCGVANLPDFREHRHDQSLLTLLCLRQGIQALDLGDKAPCFDEKNPARVANAMANAPVAKGMTMLALNGFAQLLGNAESLLRRIASKR